MTTLPSPNPDGTCTNCGVCDFILAEDHTKYSQCEVDMESKTFSSSYVHEEASSADEAVRFYCATCGTRHMVPEGLP